MGKMIGVIFAIGLIAGVLTVNTIADNDRERERGACIALTGTAGCDYSTMIACPDEQGMTVDTAYPCAWMPGNGEPVIVYMDHKCPGSLPRARCVELIPADQR